MNINRHGQNSDIEFNKFDEKIQSIGKKLFRMFGLWFVFCCIFGLGLTGALIYVAYHFINKIW